MPVQHLSLKGPNETELARTVDLEQWVADNFQAMGPEERLSCEKLLKSLESILKEWVKRVGAERGLPSDLINLGAGAKIYTSGSFRLGLLERGSDIDIVVVVPSHVSREHFFGQSPEVGLYHTLSQVTEVDKLVSISDAAVPILNFTYSGIEIDLGFAALEQSVIPEDLDLNDDNLLRNVDDGCRKALNGPRVTNLISDIAAPVGENFTKVLMCVRIWARKRAIYSNKTGFLGGVNWSILVAFTCSLYPNQTASVLLHKFFWFMKEWKWPNPISINEPADPGFPGMRVWDAVQSWRDCMPILTPAYPVQNSSYSVSKSTLGIMQMEFERGFNLSAQALQEEGKQAWDKLFEPTDFFIRFNRYFVFKLTAATPSNLFSWAGRFEARLRKLVVLLENHQPRGLFNTVFPHPKPTKVFEGRLAAEGDPVLEHQYFLGFALDETKMPKVGQQSINIDHWTENDVSNWTKKTEDMQLETNITTWKGLPDFVFKDGREAAAALRKERGYSAPKKKKGKKRKAEELGAAAEVPKAAPAAPADTPPPPPPPPPPPLVEGAPAEVREI